MSRFIVLLAVAAMFMLAALPVDGAEIRIYRFVPDGSLPYRASCGECGPPYAGARADIEGTFTVALDRIAGIGTLVALDDRLVNEFDEIYTYPGTTLKPRDETFPNSGIIPAYLSSYEPPLDGVLTAQAGQLILSSDGIRLSSDGQFYSIVTSYSIAMDGVQATLSMTVPIDDYYITVTNAMALQIIPEPSAQWLAVMGVPALFRFRRTQDGWRATKQAAGFTGLCR